MSFLCCLIFTKLDRSCIAFSTKVGNEKVKKSDLKRQVVFSFNIFSMFGFKKYLSIINLKQLLDLIAVYSHICFYEDSLNFTWNFDHSMLVNHHAHLFQKWKSWSHRSVKLFW
jgi:hypothetical protein